MRISCTACVALIVLTMACTSKEEHPPSPAAAGTARAKAGEYAKPPLPEKGRLWISHGAEWPVVAVGSYLRQGAATGKLYLWHPEQQEWHGVGGILERIPFDGLAEVSSISWSPNRKEVVFYEPVGDHQRRLCWLDLASVSGVGPKVYRLTPPQATTPHAWSPNSGYLAFIERRPSGSRLRCLTRKRTSPFDMPIPEGRAIGNLRWAPDSSRLLAVACVREPRHGLKDKISRPALFLTGPGAEEPQIVWQDERLEDHMLRAQWADGGKLIVFSLAHCTGGYSGVSGPLLGIRPNGTGLRVLWEEPEVMSFELSPDGRRALLWLLPGGQWHDGAPEPKHMAAVNLIDGTTRLYEEDMVALEQGTESGGFTGTIEWADDGGSVSLVVCTFPDVRDLRRVTLDLP